MPTLYVSYIIQFVFDSCALPTYLYIYIKLVSCCSPTDGGITIWGNWNIKEQGRNGNALWREQSGVEEHKRTSGERGNIWGNRERKGTKKHDVSILSNVLIVKYHILKMIASSASYESPSSWRVPPQPPLKMCLSLNNLKMVVP